MLQGRDGVSQRMQSNFELLGFRAVEFCGEASRDQRYFMSTSEVEAERRLTESPDGDGISSAR